MMADCWSEWLRQKMPYVIAVRLSVAEAESSLLGQARALGDAALIRRHGKRFSSLSSRLIFQDPLVEPVYMVALPLPSCPNIVIQVSGALLFYAQC